MKLIVEVIDAHDLMPKDTEGSSSAFVEIDFENQITRTTTIPKNLNPIWNQKLFFDLPQTTNHHNKQSIIEVSVYNERRSPYTNNSPVRNFLGRIKIPFSNIVNKGEEAYQVFQLENKWFFSSVKGEIGLKIYLSPEAEPNKLSDSHNPKEVALSSSTTTASQTENSSSVSTSDQRFMSLQSFGTLESM